MSEEFSDKTYRELQQICRENGVSAVGKRDLLESRLIEFYAIAEEEDDDDEEEEEEEEEGDNAGDNVDSDEAVTDNDEEDEEEDGNIDIDLKEGDLVEINPEIVNELLPEGSLRFSLVLGSVGSVDDLDDRFDDDQDNDDAEDDDEDDYDDYDEDDDDDYDYDEDFDAVLTHVSKHGLANSVAWGLFVFEILVFAIHLLFMNSDGSWNSFFDEGTAKSYPSKSGMLENGKETVSEFVMQNLIDAVCTSMFWMRLMTYLLLFAILPRMFGMFLGSVRKPENVFGYALTRGTLFYLFTQYAFFEHLMFPFLPREVFVANTAVSLTMAFWEKQAIIGRNVGL